MAGYPRPLPYPLRFHSEGRSPGDRNQPKNPVVSPERAPPRTTCNPLPTTAVPRVVRHHAPCRAARCHPVGVNHFRVVRVPRAMPWAVEYDPLGVGDGGAVASSAPVAAPAGSVGNVRRVTIRAAWPDVIDVICRAEIWRSRRVAASNPEGARFHSEGRSPGNGNHPQNPVVSPERAPPVSAIGVVYAARCRDRGREVSTPRIPSCAGKNARGVQ